MKTTLGMTPLGSAGLMASIGAVLLSAAAVRIGGLDAVHGMNFSENWFEHIQHATLLVCAFLCLVTAFRGRRWLWLPGAAFFLLLLGEELNWGQELFLFETPESIAAVNAHDELSIHNLDILISYSKLIGMAVFGAFFVAANALIAFARPRALTTLMAFNGLFAASVLTQFAARVFGYDYLALFVVDEIAESMVYLGVLGGLFLLPRDLWGSAWGLISALKARFFAVPAAPA